MSSGRVLLAEIGEQFFAALAQCCIGEAAWAAEFRQEDVLKHREVGREAGLLHHDGDAGVERLACRR